MKWQRGGIMKSKDIFLAVVRNGGGAPLWKPQEPSFLCDHIHRETLNQRLDLLWHFALYSLGSDLCCKEWTLKLYHCFCNEGNISITRWIRLIVCGEDALGELQRCSRCVTSLTPWDRFPKVQLPERGGIIMSISKSVLLIVWVQTRVLLLCGNSTGGWWYNSKLPVHNEPQIPACRFNIHEFRLIKSSAACLSLRLYSTLYCHGRLLWQEL